MKFLFAFLMALSLTQAFAFDESITVFEESSWENRRITDLEARVVINKHNEVGVYLRIVTPKFLPMTSQCRTMTSSRNCKVSFETIYLNEFQHDPSTDIVYLNGNVCGKVVNRRFFGRKVVMAENCELTVTKSNRTFKVELTDKSI